MVGVEKMELEQEDTFALEMVVIGAIAERVGAADCGGHSAARSGRGRSWSWRVCRRRLRPAPVDQEYSNYP